MAKGGTNLNPGADATLVAAATKAAMANVPKDLSGTFESMSLTYDSAMKSIGTAFGEAAKNIGKIGGQLALEAADKISLMNYGGGVNIDILDKEVENLDDVDLTKKSGLGPRETQSYQAPDIDIKATKVKTETFADRIRSIRKELSGLRAKNDPASQKRRRQLKAERDSKFAVLRKMRDDDMFNDQLLASNNVNYNATGSLNLAMKQGINAWWKKKDGVIKEGLYKDYKASLVTDDDGEMSWVLRDKNDNLVTGRNGDELTIGGDKPYMVKFNEQNTMLTPNMDQKAVDDINKVIANEEIRGKKEGTSFMGNALLSKFKTSLNNETWLHQATDITFGDSQSTLREKLHNPSAASAELFVGLGSAKLTAMKDDQGNALFKDANNDGVIGDNPATEEIETGDFFGGDPETNKNNMAKLTNAILNKEDDNYDVENLKYFLEKEILSAGGAMFKVGEAQRTTKTQKNNNITTNPFGTKSIQIGDTWLSANDRWQRRKIIQAGQGGFTGVYGDYAPTKDGWTRDQGDGPEPIGLYKMMQDEQLLVAGDVDPSIKQKEQQQAKKEQQQANMNYSVDRLTNTVKGLTDEKDIMNALKAEFKDTKFKFDYTFGDGKEIVKVKYGDGEWKKFVLSGNIAQQITNYMNFKNPKDGAKMIWPSGEHKGKEGYAKDGKWYLVKE